MRVGFLMLLLSAYVGNGVLCLGQSAPAPIDFESVPDGTSPDTRYPGVTLIGGSVLTAGLSLNEADFPPRSGIRAWADTGGPISARFRDPVSTVSVAVTSSQRVVAVMYPPGIGAPNEVLLIDAATGSSPVPRTVTAQLSLPGGGTIERVLFRGASTGDSFTLDELSFTTAPRPPSINNLTVQPERLRFEHSIGGAVAPPLRVYVDTAEPSLFTVTSTAAWLRASVDRLQSPTEVLVGIVPTGLVSGVYTASLTFRNSVSSAQLFVTLTVLNPPELFTLPTMVSFTQKAGGAPPPPQTVFVGSRNTNLIFSMAPQESWITTTQTGPQTPANMAVRVDGGTRQPGIYEGSVVLTPMSTTQTPLVVRVRLEVTP